MKMNIMSLNHRKETPMPFNEKNWSGVTPLPQTNHVYNTHGPKIDPNLSPMPAIRQSMAPTTNTWGEALSRMTPLASEAWMIDDMRGQKIDGRMVAGASALSLLGLGGLAKIAGNQLSDVAKMYPKQQGAFVGKKGADYADMVYDMPDVKESQLLAQKLKDKNWSDSEIWRKTAEETGYPTTTAFPDGHIQTEITDHKAKIYLPKTADEDGFFPLSELKQGRLLGAPTRTIYQHPELFKYYPSLGKEPLLITEPGVLGDFVTAARGKNINYLDAGRLQKPRRAKGDIAHELSHAVDEFEGMGTGTNDKHLASMIDEASEPYTTANEMLHLAHLMRKDPTLTRYDLLNELFNNPTPLRDGFPKASIYNNPDYQEYSVNQLLRYGPNWYREMLDDMVVPRIKEAGGWHALSGYLKTASEAKARLVDERLLFTPDERKATYPFAKIGADGYMDTPLEGQMVRDVNGKNMNPEKVIINHPRSVIKKKGSDWVSILDPDNNFAEGGVVKADRVDELLDAMDDSQFAELMEAVMDDKPQNFADGGLVGKNPFNSTTSGLFGQMDLIHPKNKGSAPLDIPLNSNNMLATARAGTPQAQHYRTR